MSPKVTPEYSDFRRRQIVTAAWECFTEKGYHQTTIRDVARKLRLSTGIVYRYFKGKADILEAVQKCGRADTKKLLARMAQKRTARAAVQELIRTVTTQMPVEVRRRNARGAIGLWAEALNRPGYRRIYRYQYKLVEKTLSQIISNGIRRGEFQRKIDPDAFAAFILALISGLQVQSALNENLDFARYCESVETIVLGNAWRKGKT